MEPDTVTTPKINKTTFKLGGGLNSQVAANTQKITILRRVVTKQGVKISESITPKIDSMQESLLQTNIILTDVASQLKKDFSSRLREQRELLEEERKKSSSEKRNLKEQRLEGKKVGKFGKDVADKITKPFKSVFSALSELALILGTGLLVNTLADSKELRDGLVKVFDWSTKNWKLIATVGGVLVGLKLLGVVKLLLSLGKIIKSVVFSKAFILTSLFFAPALYKRLDPYVMMNLTELEKMGGVTKENRDKLIAQKQAELDAEKAKNILLQRPVLIRNLKKDIQFLKTGGMGSKDFNNEYRQKIDFDKLESGATIEESILKKGRDYHLGGFNAPGMGVGRVHEGEFVVKKSAVDRMGLDKLYAINDGTFVNYSFQDLPPIDLRTIKNVSKVNQTPATKVPSIKSTNANNHYMNEVPIAFGFDNLVYS